MKALQIREDIVAKDREVIVVEMMTELNFYIFFFSEIDDKMLK